MRLLIVSNRLPLTISLENNQYIFKKSYGGLATGLSSFLERYQGSDTNESLWLGWPGIAGESKQNIKEKLILENNCYPVFLHQDLIDSYYNGFCNQTLWPLFHDFVSFTKKDPTQWDAYKEANMRYFLHLSQLIAPGDAIWVHDYHLMLLPTLIKQHFPTIPVGFFLHIPFPQLSVFTHLEKSWQKELIQGMARADVIGFHTKEYAQNFHQAALSHNQKPTITDKIGVFPIGIDYQYFVDGVQREEAQEKVERYKRQFTQKKVILSVDRLDYIKGIPNRLHGYQEFLQTHPSYKGNVVFMVIAAPSRTDIPHYQQTQKEVEHLVYTINKQFGTKDWQPILYEYKGYSLEELTALYTLADVMLVTSVKDGMNLVAKEYLACKTDNTGVLILSKNAGVSHQLKHALIINPQDITSIAESIHQALEMSPTEQRERNKPMRESIQKEDIFYWANQFIDQLLATQNNSIASTISQNL